MTMPLKLCKDCRYCRDGKQCDHPASVNIDLVTGAESRWPCSSMRLSPRCDTEGKLFEPREGETR